MLVLLPIIVYLFLPILLIPLRLFRLRLGISWLISLIAAFAIWLLFILTIGSLPVYFDFPVQSFAQLPDFQFSFVIDHTSWPLAAALSAFVLGQILSSITWLPQPDQSRPFILSWQPVLFYAGLGMWAILATNYFTLLLAWSLMDITWFSSRIINSPEKRIVLYGYALRIIGSFFLMAASITLDSGSSTLLWVGSDQTRLLVIFAAWLRFISLSFDSHTDDKMLSLLGNKQEQIIPISASILIIFMRNSQQGISTPNGNLLLILFGLICLLSVMVLMGNIYHNKSSIAIPVILLSFVTISTLINEPLACSAWAVALIIFSSICYLFKVYNRYLLPIILVSILGISTLPFTPAWQGVRIFPAFDQIFSYGYTWIFIAVSLGIFIALTLRYFISSKNSLPGSERWGWTVYVTGLLIPITTQLIILFLGVPGLSNNLQAFPSLNSSWASFLVICISLSAWLLHRPLNKIMLKITKGVMKFSPVSFLDRLIDQLLPFFIRFTRFIDLIIEGEGGVLWTILFLLLLITVFIQLNSGG